MFKRSRLAGALLALGGCILDLGECGPMTRSTQVEGELREGATVLVDAAVEVVEASVGIAPISLASRSWRPTRADDRDKPRDGHRAARGFNFSGTASPD
jgi:hypothetical protein